MASWDGWPLERMVYVFIGLAFLLVWGQVTLYHWAAGFRSVYMWGPVVYTPVLALVALLMSAARADWISWLFGFVFAFGVLEGLFGVYKHLGGVRERVGGFSLRNFMAGPPVLLPVIYAALAGFALLVFFWDLLVPARAVGG